MLALLTRAYDEGVAASSTEHDEAIAALNAQHASAIAALNAQHEAAIASLNQQHQQALASEYQRGYAAGAESASSGQSDPVGSLETVDTITWSALKTKLSSASGRAEVEGKTYYIEPPSA